MGLIDRIRHILVLRRFRAEGRRQAKEIEANWRRLKELIRGADQDPDTANAMFVGAMKSLHDQQRDLFATLQASNAEYQGHWQLIAAEFARRFRSELLAPLYAGRADAMPSEQDIVRVLVDVDTEVAQFKRTIERDKESLLDRAVKAVRVAEEAGRFARDPRSDEEMKESIRTAWNKQ